MNVELYKITLVLFSVAALIPGMRSRMCEKSEIKCLESGGCFSQQDFCNGHHSCRDGSDERYCNSSTIFKEGGCPLNWYRCKLGNRCIPKTHSCNRNNFCHDEEANYETFCEGKARKALTNFFIEQLKSNMEPISRQDYFRVIVALHLMDVFTTTEFVGKLRSKMLSALTTDLKSNELSMSIHALMATCSDPWDFHGFNLVSELRTQVDRSGLPSPFDLLALCNAHDTMTPQDAQRAADAFVSKGNGYTRDNQAMALQALACIRSRINFTLNGTSMTAMEQELKHLQFDNGTTGSIRTTALVLQALIATQSSQEDFRYYDAMEAILKTQNADYYNRYRVSFGSLSDSYYIAPLLNYASFLNISNSHCEGAKKDEGAFPGILNRKSRYRTKVQYSIMMGAKKTETWTLYVPNKSSLYNVTAILMLLGSSSYPYSRDYSCTVLYNVEGGKPYVASVNGVQEDLERGLYWLTFVRSNNTRTEILEMSHVDIKIRPSREYILWYKARE